MSSLRSRWAAVLGAAAIALTGAQAASATTDPAAPVGDIPGSPGLLDCAGAPATCVVLPPFDGHGPTGGGKTPPDGGPKDGGVPKGGYCAALKASMGSYADTPAGMKALASYGC